MAGVTAVTLFLTIAPSTCKATTVIKIAVQSRFQGPLLPVPWSERERDPGKRWSRVSQNLGDDKHNIEGGAGKFSPLLLTCQTLPLCYVLSSPRFWETKGGAGKFSPLLLNCQTLLLCYVLSSPRFWEKRDQRFPGSFSLSRSRGREGEDPGNEVGLPFCMLQVKHVASQSYHA